MSDRTAFPLDERQRAMLAEMGVRVWQPTTTAAMAEVAPPETAKIAIKNIATLAPAAAPSAPPANTPVARVPAPAAPPVAPAAQAPALTPQRSDIATLDWPALQQAVADCRACELCATRRQTVFGIGAQRADWMVIGEAPGEQEDRQGEPFVGPAGQLLDNMLRAIALSRRPDEADPQGLQGAYIANVLKCRPPGNRNPQPHEMAQCEPFLQRQIALVQPKIILAMGRFAVQMLLQSTEPIGKLRGRVHHYQGVPVIVTYHPAYLLRNLPEKAKAWQDLLLAVKTLREVA